MIILNLKDQQRYADDVLAQKCRSVISGEGKNWPISGDLFNINISLRLIVSHKKLTSTEEISTSVISPPSLQLTYLQKQRTILVKLNFS